MCIRDRLYTIQRYLQYRLLQELGLIHLDDWASSFGETVTAIELSPEGTGYRAKTRFAKFYNLPELMAAFKEVADIQTADMLKPVSYTHLAWDIDPKRTGCSCGKALTFPAQRNRCFRGIW